MPKYVEQFNKRITPLLVCFHPDIRNKILIKNPDERQYFTSEECELCSGFPNKMGDQDTYEELMKMDDKEIRFWKKHPEWEIPYLDICEMNWDEILQDYEERMEREKNLGINAVRDLFYKNISTWTSSEIEDFENGSLPSALNNVLTIDPVTGYFVSKDYPDIVIGTIYDVFDAIETRQKEMELFDVFENNDEK